MLASRLLGLGKEKFKVRSDIAYCDLDCEELEELLSLEDPNPVDHDLATVVRRYLGIRMEKARMKLQIRMQVDRQRLGPESALRVMNGQKPQGTASRILRPRVSETLVPPAQQRTRNCFGRLRITPIPRIESFDVQEEQALRIDGS